MGLTHLTTHYRIKQELIATQKKNIQILSLGSSNAYFAINPSYFSCAGFNYAYNAQSPYYDLQLVKKYIDELPNLKLVILPAIFYTIGTNLANENSGNAWRIFFYKHYFHIRNEHTNLNIADVLKQEVKPKNFSLIALHGDMTEAHIKNGFQGLLDAKPETNGWFNSEGSPPVDLSKLIGPQGADSHSNAFNSENALANLAYWQELITILKKRGVDVVIIRSPEHSSYSLNLDQSKVIFFSEQITQMANLNKIQYKDYSNDPRFDAEDFIFYVDHMSKKGAEKFSKVLNNEIISRYCMKFSGKMNLKK
jgi:hypothetical protein